MDEAEPLAIATFPFEVVQQRPDEAAADVRTILDCRRKRSQMSFEEGDPSSVLAAALGIELVVVGASDLGYDQQGSRSPYRASSIAIVVRRPSGSTAMPMSVSGSSSGSNSKGSGLPAAGPLTVVDP